MSKSHRRFANYFIAPRAQFIFSAQMVVGALALAELQIVVMGIPGADGSFFWAKLVLALSIVAIVLYTLVVSHRVFGPVHAMEVYADKLLAGEADGPLTLRKGDYFTDLAARLSKIQEKLAEQEESAASNMSEAS